MVEAFSLENLPFEAYKASLDSSAIIGDRNADEYNTHGLAFINAVPDGKDTTLDSCRDFIYNAVLENLASNPQRLRNILQSSRPAATTLVR